MKESGGEGGEGAGEGGWKMRGADAFDGYRQRWLINIIEGIWVIGFIR